MQFTPRELSKKLLELGCVSKSGFYWGWDKKPMTRDQILTWHGRELSEFGIDHPYSEPPAFTLCDFVGMGDRQVRNRQVLFGWEVVKEDCPGCSAFPHNQEDPLPAYYYHNLALVESLDWIDYLRKAVGL